MLTNLLSLTVPCNPTMREQTKTELLDDDWLSMAPTEEDNDVIDVKSADAPDDDDDDDDDDGDVPDAEDFDGDNLVEEEDDPALKQNLVQKTRTYDVTICYDMYHRVPHVWLVGYDKNNHPLKPTQMYEDISKDHVGETVTIKPHPHLGLPYASIHPCRHADVMKKIVKNMQSSGREPRSDLYLFIFLKFLSAVIPSIEYDNTFDLDISLRSEEPN
jgi:ubiquitin-like-conjugating enzyme ATG3